jgi:hypothetical protein
MLSALNKKRHEPYGDHRDRVKIEGGPVQQKPND